MIIIESGAGLTTPTTPVYLYQAVKIDCFLF